MSDRAKFWVVFAAVWAIYLHTVSGTVSTSSAELHRLSIVESYCAGRPQNLRPAACEAVTQRAGYCADRIGEYAPGCSAQERIALMRSQGLY